MKSRTWVEDIVTALENLDGVANYEDIYGEVKRIRTVALPDSWKACIRERIEAHSSNSLAFKKGKDIFYSVEGIGNGVWGLRSKISQPTSTATDINEPEETQRVKQDVYRILRDTFLGRSIKALYHNSCQICGKSITIKGKPYAEAHHVRPLGKPHNGPDKASNIIVLCPNHHVMCDYGAIKIEIQKLSVHADHKISLEFVEYHNKVIFNS